MSPKMPGKFYSGEQLWFGLGTIADHEHEPRARVLSESRTTGLSLSLLPLSFLEVPRHRSLPFLLSALIIHPCLNAPKSRWVFIIPFRLRICEVPLILTF